MPLYYRGSHVALIVYDVTSYASFNNSLKYIDDLKSKIEEITIILVGNKIDLPKIILTEDINTIINKYNLLFVECSAKTGEGVDQLFNLVMW